MSSSHSQVAQAKSITGLLTSSRNHIDCSRPKSSPVPVQERAPAAAKANSLPSSANFRRSGIRRSSGTPGTKGWQCQSEASDHTLESVWERHLEQSQAHPHVTMLQPSRDCYKSKNDARAQQLKSLTSKCSQSEPQGVGQCQRALRIATRQVLSELTPPTPGTENPRQAEWPSLESPPRQRVVASRPSPRTATEGSVGHRCMRGAEHHTSRRVVIVSGELSLSLSARASGASTKQ